MELLLVISAFMMVRTYWITFLEPVSKSKRNYPQKMKKENKQTKRGERKKK